jgi:hypothetical protein
MTALTLWDDAGLCPCPTCNGTGLVPCGDNLPRSRNTDPGTSHAAGHEYEDQRIQPGSPRHRALQPFASHETGLTGPEVQELVGGNLDTKETIRKRINELHHARLIETTGNTRPNLRSHRHRQCRIYTITPLGRAVLSLLDAGRPWPRT